MTESKYSSILIASAIDFLRDAGTELGADFGHEKANAMMDAFDPELKAQVFMHLLVGDYMSSFRLRLSPGTQQYQMIQAIKAVRAVTGYGLKEAKDVVDATRAGQIVEIKGRWSNDDRRKFATELAGTGFELI
jgi:hypothetical protein